MKFIKTDRITVNPDIMNGKPCIRGMRITVGAITDLIVSGVSFEEILELYPYLEREDIKAVISYISWCTEEYFLKPVMPCVTELTYSKKTITVERTA